MDREPKAIGVLSGLFPYTLYGFFGGITKNVYGFLSTVYSF